MNKRLNTQVAERQLAGAEKESTEASERRYHAAESDKAIAEAEKARRAKPQPGKTPEETTLHDLMTGENGQPRINPDTGQPYSYLEAYGAVQQAKSDTKPPKDTPLTAQEISDYNAGLADRYKVLNPGASLPPYFSLKQGATAKDFDRIDKIMQQTEQAAGN